MTNSVSMKVVSDTLLPAYVKVQVGGEVSRGFDLNGSKLRHDARLGRGGFRRPAILNQAVQFVQITVGDIVDLGPDQLFGRHGWDPFLWETTPHYTGALGGS